jgi:hypothetical protein
MKCECEASFQELKRRLVIAPIFTLPMESIGYVVYTKGNATEQQNFRMKPKHYPYTNASKKGL